MENVKEKRKLSVEHKRNISKALKGRRPKFIPNNTGRKHTEETKNKMRKARMGRPPGNQLPKGEAALNHLFGTYKRVAKRRKLDFTITKKEFYTLTQTNCFYCNCPPENEWKVPSLGLNGSYLYNGIDRVNNKKGYVSGNCVACCEFCNRTKRNYSTQEFLGHIAAIYSHSCHNEQYELLAKS